MQKKGMMGAVVQSEVPCSAESLSIQGPSSTPFLPAPGPHLPFPTAKPTMTSTPTSIQAFIMEFRGQG
jgi:hypothetical protein